MIFPSAAATRIRGPSCIDVPTADQDYAAWALPGARWLQPGARAIGRCEPSELIAISAVVRSAGNVALLRPSRSGERNLHRGILLRVVPLHVPGAVPGPEHVEDLTGSGWIRNGSRPRRQLRPSGRDGRCRCPDLFRTATTFQASPQFTVITSVRTSPARATCGVGGNQQQGLERRHHPPRPDPGPCCARASPARPRAGRRSSAPFSIADYLYQPAESRSVDRHELHLRWCGPPRLARCRRPAPEPYGCRSSRPGHFRPVTVDRSISRVACRGRQANSSAARCFSVLGSARRAALEELPDHRCGTHSSCTSGIFRCSFRQNSPG